VSSAASSRTAPAREEQQVDERRDRQRTGDRRERDLPGGQQDHGQQQRDAQGERGAARSHTRVPAPRRTTGTREEAPGAERFLPEQRDLPSLALAVQGCRGCPLYRDAEQAVFGEGDPRARLVLVGEQPGDVEDRTGHPFVGPAGRLLFEVLAELGVERGQVYVTNAVKHFAFTPKGKRRIHRTPSLTDLVACQPWLTAELAVLEPEVVVLLGATALRSVLGPGRTVTALRGRLLPQPSGPDVLVTTHPSAVLRSTHREQARSGLRSDLAVAVSASRR
jgi:uracil-DNA glycosylase